MHSNINGYHHGMDRRALLPEEEDPSDEIVTSLLEVGARDVAVLTFLELISPLTIIDAACIGHFSGVQRSVNGQQLFQKKFRIEEGMTDAQEWVVFNIITLSHPYYERK